MVDDPLKYLDPFAACGFKRFLGHVEKMKDIDEFVARGQLLGEVGLALDSTTSVDDIKISLEDLDCLLIMGAKAGHSGEDFLPEVLEKIKILKQKTTIPIEIDGGINDKIIADIKNAGADRFVVTSNLFSKQDPQLAYETLNGLIKSRLSS